MSNDPRRSGTPLRDGTETLPEPLDMSVYEAEPEGDEERPDVLVLEALLESFPASDPPASGHMTPDLHHETATKDKPHG